MNKTITIPTATQLQQYHLELQQRERQETKDKCILLSLAIAGLIGVYALVMNGVGQSSITDQADTQVEHQAPREATGTILDL